MTHTEWVHQCIKQHNPNLGNLSQIQDIPQSNQAPSNSAAYLSG